MKDRQIVFVCFPLFSLLERGLGGETRPPSASDNKSVPYTLRAFDNHVLTLDDVMRDGDARWSLEVVNFYLSNPTNVSTNSKLAVSRCFMVLDRPREAGKLVTEYLLSNSNDWRAWRILGAASMTMSNDTAAIYAYSNAVALGCDYGCVSQLGLCAMAAKRTDLVRPYLPRLLELSKTQKSQGNDPLDALAVLLAYCVETEDESTLMKSLKGVKKSELSSREDVKEVVARACETFTSKEAQDIFRALGFWREQDPKGR